MAKDETPSDLISLPGNSHFARIIRRLSHGVLMDDWQISKSIIEANNYMLRNEIACDVTFITGQSREEIRAHRYMLVSRSSVLYDMLSSHPGLEDIAINAYDISTETMRQVLGYIYTDTIDVNPSNVASILHAAKRLALKGLTKLSFKFLDADMHFGNVCKIMEQAHMYNENSLYDKCKKLILTNANDVLQTPGFSELCADCIGAILKSDDLRATEELIFEATMSWATNQCRHQKIQPSDESRRTVLGPLLYHIRFPTMDVVYFTQRVSFRDILSQDEAVSIFQYFHGEENTVADKFSKSERNRLTSKRQTVVKFEESRKSRRNRDLKFNDRTFTNPEKIDLFNPQIDLKRSFTPNMSCVTRFAGYDGPWKQNGPPDAISFTCSVPIVLYGVQIYGCLKGCETYTVKLTLFDDFKEECRKNDVRITTDSMRHVYDAIFTRPIRVPPARKFTVMVVMKGCPTVKGVDGTAVHVIDGVTFEFSDSNRSSNGTGVTIGQIAGLLFNKTE